MRAFYDMARMMTGGVRQARVLLKQCIVATYGVLPDAYVITCGRWAPELLQKSWAGSV